MRIEPWRVLLVEDSPADAKLIRLALEEARDPAFEVDWVQDGPDAVARLAKEGLDAVLTDLNLPSSAGLDTLGLLLPAARGLPLVVLTGSRLDAPVGREALRLGAQDYLDKGSLDGRVLARVLEFAIERKDLERLREEFFENINHELRTPLTVATGFLRCLLDDATGPAQAGPRRALEIVTRNVGYMTQLVEEFVEATRAGAGKLVVTPRRCELSALVLRTVEEFRLVAEEKGLTLLARCPAELAPALADPARCRQILFNLIANAIKFTPRGGKVSVEAAALPGEPERLRLSVADTGPGVPAEVRTRIFERLFRGRGTAKDGRRGLGLGLFICGELARRQGGRIWVEGNPDGGSRFHFTVPRFSYAAALEPLLGAGPLPAELRLLEFRLPYRRNGPAGPAASELLAEASDVLRAGAGPQGLLLPEAAREGAEGALYVASRGGAAAAGRLAKRLERLLEAEPRLRGAGQRIRIHPVASRLGGGNEAELEREVAAIVSPGPARRREPALPF